MLILYLGVIIIVIPNQNEDTQFYFQYNSLEINIETCMYENYYPYPIPEVGT